MLGRNCRSIRFIPANIGFVPRGSARLQVGAKHCQVSNLSATCRMEHRGIRYTVRTGIERDQWVIAIHPGDVEMAGKVVNGNREQAEAVAHSLINKWLDRHQ